MAYHSLILGVLLSIGVFAVKSGAGLAYLVNGQIKSRMKILGLLLFCLIYLIIFSSVLLMIENINPLNHLTQIQNFIQSGMIIHLIMALLMMLWGILLLKNRNHTENKKSRAWLILSLPCPVCITVIFISTGFLITLFPDTPHIVVFGLYASFILINLLTVFLISLYGKLRNVQPEAFLGTVMLLIAVYFLISVTVMPNFADVDKIYRLAMYEGQKQSLELAYIVLCTIITALAFLSGFFYKHKRIKGV